MMLTQDEVIAFAREAGFVGYGEDLGEYRIPAPAFISRLHRVAQACYEAGAKAENGACEQIAETSPSKYHCAAAIRERRK